MQSRHRLISAARQRFGTIGYAATSMDELTAAVGLTRGALYHQFGGKEGLLAAVVAEIDDEIASRLAERVSGAGGWERLRIGARGFLETALEPEVQRIVLRDAPAVLGSGDRAMHSACHAGMAELLQTLMDAGMAKRADAQVLARMLSGALSHAALWIASSAEPELSFAQASAAIDALLDGLRQDSGAEGGAGG